MRYVVLDTETTGLSPEQGHRVIEIGALELNDRQATGRTFHVYLNPDREVDAGALEVHGLSNEFLADKPRFESIANEFLDFIADAELIIHNAPFDIGFLNSELARLDKGKLAGYCSGVLDTLKQAREMHPGQRNNLDALCKRYEVDNSNRAYHGALLDAQLLAEVYLAMTRGQDSLIIEMAALTPRHLEQGAGPVELTVLRADADELAAHAAYLAAMSKEAGGEVGYW
ncbi:MAG: DNA polymerase III subunit epsilon [Hydrogenophilales bacterium]|nr:DNA polymerase III subunit epsilon [Hydrogenophilales bacterium]